MQRIQDFLKEDEVPDWASTLSSAPMPNSSHLADDKIGFSEASFEWEEPSDTAGSSPARFQLGPLDVVFPTGELTIISGATGSGKSALLAALLGGKFFRID